MAATARVMAPAIASVEYSPWLKCATRPSIETSPDGDLGTAFLSSFNEPAYLAGFAGSCFDIAPVAFFAISPPECLVDLPDRCSGEGFRNMRHARQRVGNIGGRTVEQSHRLGVESVVPCLRLHSCGWLGI